MYPASTDVRARVCHDSATGDHGQVAVAAGFPVTAGSMETTIAATPVTIVTIPATIAATLVTVSTVMAMVPGGNVVGSQVL